MGTLKCGIHSQRPRSDRRPTHAALGRVSANNEDQKRKKKTVETASRYPPQPNFVFFNALAEASWMPPRQALPRGSQQTPTVRLRSRDLVDFRWPGGNLAGRNGDATQRTQRPRCTMMHLRNSKLTFGVPGRAAMIKKSCREFLLSFILFRFYILFESPASSRKDFG